MNNQSYFKFDELLKSILHDELFITVQQPFRNYSYSLKFLLLKCPIQIYPCNLWKTNTNAYSISCSVNVTLGFGFVLNLLPRGKLYLAAHTSGEMSIVSSISLLSLKKEWFTSWVFFFPICFSNWYSHARELSINNHGCGFKGSSAVGSIKQTNRTECILFIYNYPKRKRMQMSG